MNIVTSGQSVNKKPLQFAGLLGSHLDRHELIGKGKIGKEPFNRIMNDKRLRNIPLILETPDMDAWEREIKMLYSMMDA